MRIRNDERGYGFVTVYLHWLTVLLLLGPVRARLRDGEPGRVVPRGDGQPRARPGRRRRAAGVRARLARRAILALALVRIGWRLATPLPPWDERLTEGDRRASDWAELVLYWLLLLTPSSGLALLYLSGKEREVATGEWQPPFDVVGDDLLLALHIACHIALYVTLLIHVAVAVRRRTLARIL